MAPCELTVSVQQRREDGAFTNNDIVSGHVDLKVYSEMTVSHVEVKLEGVTNTAIYIRRRNGQNNGSNERITEEHTVLYHTMVVFPPEDVRSVSECKEFTLIPGEYQYPFQFQIPMNNDCKDEGNSIFRRRAHHIQWLLPPSLTGLGEFATVKYFVKATAKRPSLIKSSVRVFSPLDFFPYDTTFPTNGSGSAFRKDFHIKNKIPHTIVLPDSKGKKMTPQKTPGFFRSLFSHSDPSVATVDPRTMSYTLEVRCGYPACVTRGQPLAMELLLISNSPLETFTLVDGESSGLGELYLRGLDIRLHSMTDVAVRGYSRGKQAEDRILNLKDKDIKLDFAHAEPSMDPNGNSFCQLRIPPEVTSEAILPHNISPSFRSCNITRTYQLFIKALVSGSETGRTTKVSQTIDVIVHSGMRQVEPVPEYQPPPTVPLPAEASKENALPSYQVATDN